MSADPQTIGVYDARADDYADTFGKGQKPGTRLLEFCAQLPAGGRVLDYGCGPATDGAHMAAMGFEVHAFDASDKMVQAARANGVTAHQATFAEFDAQNTYDGIWANFSLLHAPRKDVPDLLANIHIGLKPGGIFHIGVKTGDGTARDTIGRRYTYFTIPELNTLLTQTGFTIIATHEGEGPGLDGTISPWVVMLCKRDG